MSLSPNFQEVKLFTTDFDGTYAQTFEPSPNGMTVHRAYELAIWELFGDDNLELYRASGGLRNRAPIEVVAELAPQLEAEAQSQRAEDLIQIKLGHLNAEVGQRFPDGELWPRVAPGFTAVWQAVSFEPAVDTGVISSGHRAFIERFHDIHELEQPDIMLTDDDMRPLLNHLSPEECTKPSRLLMEIMHHRWLEKNKVEDFVHLLKSKDRIVYSGDDPVKDGQLARNYGVEFILIDRDNPTPDWQKMGRLLIPGFSQEVA